MPPPPLEGQAGHSYFKYIRRLAWKDKSKKKDISLLCLPSSEGWIRKYNYIFYAEKSPFLDFPAKQVGKQEKDEKLMRVPEGRHVLRFK